MIEFDSAKAVNVWRTQDVESYIMKELETRVKKDLPTKKAVLATGSSAYLPEPMNLFISGPPGIGKTYIVVQTLRYFPQEDVWYLGALSKKALIHDRGVLVNEDGEPIDLMDRPFKPKKKDFKTDEEYAEALEDYKEKMKAWNEEMNGSYMLIDLHHKILVFLDNPEIGTFQTLYPILSHDKEEIEYRFTDKTSYGKLQTTRVIVRGWPATIFLSTMKDYLEPLATRSFTVTPQESKEKISLANELTNLKMAYPWQYEKETEEFKTISLLMRSIKNFFASEDHTLKDIVVPFTNIYEIFSAELVRDMRDFQHFGQFLKTQTALNHEQRTQLERTASEKQKEYYLLSSAEDVKEALKTYDELFETTRTGTEQRILTFYHDIVKNGAQWYVQELVYEYNQRYAKKVSSDTIRDYLKRLMAIGYVTEKEDELKHSRNVYEPIITTEEKTEIKRFLENQQLLDDKLKIGLKTWKENNCESIAFLYNKKFTTDIKGKSIEAWRMEPISWTEAEKLIMEGSREKFFVDKTETKTQLISVEEKTVVKEKETEIHRKTEIQQISGFSFNKSEQDVREKEEKQSQT
jgi:hypothetical protein